MNRTEWIRGGAWTGSAGERVFYRVDGQGPTILFLHGYPTSSHDYAPIIARLRARYRCVTFDFLGFGASDKPRRAYSYALQHEVLARVVAATGVTDAFLVAHDYAVTLAQDFVGAGRKAPLELEGVVFLNGGLDSDQHRARPIQRLLVTRVGRVIGPLFLTKRTVLRAFRDVIVRKEAIDDDDVWASITDGGGLALMPRLLHYIAERRARREELVAALRTPRAPVAFVWGMDDPVSGGHVLEALKSFLKDAPVRKLEGVGHYPQVEAADEVAAFVDETVTRWRARNAG
jgi:pimeloyl-ACP methyl ester carboxylesterase